MGKKEISANRTFGFPANFKYEPLLYAQYLFMVIPIAILSVIYTFGGSDPLTKVLAQSTLTVQIVIAFSFPFCYLVLKSIRKKAEINKEEAKLPLLLLTAAQIINFNFICVFLLVSGLIMEYGKSTLTLDRNILKSKGYWGDASGSVIILLFALLTLFIRYRLGMLN